MERHESVEHYLKEFEAFAKNAADRDSSLRATRRKAIDRFAELGFPTTRWEEWKYTNVAPIAGERFSRPLAAQSPVELDLNAYQGALRLVFINGHFSHEHSLLAELPRGVTVKDLAESEGACGLTRYAPIDDAPFVALNTAFFRHGALIEIPDGLSLDLPVHLIYLSSPSPAPHVTHPRNLIVVGRESAATIVESYCGLGEGAYWTNGVTEIAAAQGARVDHYKLQDESLRAFHVAALHAHLGEKSIVNLHSFSRGAALCRNDVVATFAGENAVCAMNGLYLAAGDQHVDNHTVIDHAKAHCESDETYKGILDGKGRGVFNGKIIVRQDSQKTKARQSNRNLMLSNSATVDAKPQLEIFADDVQCSHGATIGKIDRDALFYLRSRGIGNEEARALLTSAFAAEVVERFPSETMRRRAFSLVEEWMKPRNNRE